MPDKNKKNLIKANTSNKLRTPEQSSEFSSEFGSFSANLFDVVFARMMTAIGTQKAVDVANALGISQQSISSAKAKQKIPAEWYIQVAETSGASMDWLRTGEGEMMRGAAAPAPQAPAAAPQRQETNIYNDMTRRSISIADMLAKTAKVLESDTVYREALYSNIEAFHHGVTMDERLSKMEEQFSQVMGKVQEQLDLNTKTISELQADNARLKEELASCRVRDELSDTG